MQALVASLLSLLLLATMTEGWLGVWLSEDHDAPVISEVIPRSPAATAGLKAGDVMLAVGDTATATRKDFIAAIKACKPGDQVSIKLRRDGKETTVLVRLGEQPATPTEDETKPKDSKPKDSKPKGQKPPQPAVEPGREAKPLAPAKSGKAYLGLALRETDKGVVVDGVRADGPAKAAGVEEGDVVTSLGDHLVKELGDLDGFLGKAKPGQKVTLGLRRGDETRSVTLRMGERVDEVPMATIEPADPQTAPTPARPRRPLRAEAPVPDAKPTPHADKPAVDLEAELAALRAELAKLRQELEELRKGKGRE